MHHHRWEERWRNSTICATAWQSLEVGTTAYGSFPETDEYGLAAEAFRNALADCGLDKGKIDGLLTCRIPSYSRVGETLGLDPSWTITLPGHGRMSGIGLIEATVALATGQANYVALLYANVGRSRRVFYGGDEFPWILGSLGFHVSRRRPCDDVQAAHGALRDNDKTAR